VLRRIFGTKRETVTGGWRKLHNEELHNQIKEDEMGEACRRHGRNRSLEILSIILKLILKKEMELESAEWIHLTQDKIKLRFNVNTVMNLRDP
jgi:hypothetical protein